MLLESIILISKPNVFLFINICLFCQKQLTNNMTMINNFDKQA